MIGSSAPLHSLGKIFSGLLSRPCFSGYVRGSVRGYVAGVLHLPYQEHPLPDSSHGASRLWNRLRIVLVLYHGEVSRQIP